MTIFLIFLFILSLSFLFSLYREIYLYYRGKRVDITTDIIYHLFEGGCLFIKGFMIILIIHMLYHILTRF